MCVLYGWRSSTRRPSPIEPHGSPVSPTAGGGGKRSARWTGELRCEGGGVLGPTGGWAPVEAVVADADPSRGRGWRVAARATARAVVGLWLWAAAGSSGEGGPFVWFPTCAPAALRGGRPHRQTVSPEPRVGSGKVVGFQLGIAFPPPLARRGWASAACSLTGGGLRRQGGGGGTPSRMGFGWSDRVWVGVAGVGEATRSPMDILVWVAVVSHLRPRREDSGLCALLVGRVGPGHGRPGVAGGW